MKKKFWICGLCLFIILLAATGCSSGERETQWLGSDGSEVEATMTVTRPPAVPTLTPQTGKEYDGSYTGGTGSYAPEMERMIIRSGNVQLVVEDVALAIDQIADMADKYSGWVVSSNSWKDNQRIYGNISIRVAAEYFETAIAELHALAVDVKSETTSGQDVTEEYVDLQAQLRTLQASEDQLLALMEKAGSVEEILAVQRELTNTRTKIEQIQGRMQYLEQSSATSLITVNLEESNLSVEFTASQRTIKAGEKISFQPQVSGGFAPYTYEWDFGDGETSTLEWPVHEYGKEGTYTVTLKITDDKGNTAEYHREDYITVQTGWSAGNIVDSALNGLAVFGRGLLNVLIWIGIFSPVWIVIGAIIFFIVRKNRRKK